MAGGHQSVDAREGEAAAGGPWGAESREVGPPRAERGAAGPQIAAAYRQGLGIEAIARRAGLPVREVYWLLGRENVAIRPARVARGTKPDTIELLRRIRAACARRASPTSRSAAPAASRRAPSG